LKLLRLVFDTAALRAPFRDVAIRQHAIYGNVIWVINFDRDLTPTFNYWGFLNALKTVLPLGRQDVVLLAPNPRRQLAPGYRSSIES
jgi:hypothetical protein